MATTTTTLLLAPSLLCHGQRTLFSSLPKFPVSTALPVSSLCYNVRRQRRVAFVVKAASDSSDSSSSQSIVKSVTNALGNSEDIIGLTGLSLAAIVGLWAATNVITAVDKLPIVPSILEFIGILFSWWFVYRYLLFKPDREELSKIIKGLISQVLD